MTTSNRTYRLRTRQPRRSGELRQLIDEDTVDGFASWTVFMTCGKRSDLWHVANTQSAQAIVVPKATLCGLTPYMQGADVKSEWSEYDRVNVCTTCSELVGEL